MPTYTATIQLSNGTLSVVRPHPSAEDADDLIDSAIYAVRDTDTTVTSVGITVVTGENPTPALPPLTEPLTEPDDEDSTSPASPSSTGSVSGPLR